MSYLMIDFIPIKTDTIYIVTHAEANGDALTDKGNESALALVERLRDLEVDGVFSAPSGAAQATIEPYAIGAGLPIALLPDLRDHQLSLQGNAPGDPYLEMRFAKRGLSRPGGESFNAAANRLRTAVLAVSRRPVIAPAMVTHPGLLAAFLSQKGSAFGYAQYLAMPVPGIWKLKHERGAPRTIDLL